MGRPNVAALVLCAAVIATGTSAEAAATSRPASAPARAALAPLAALYQLDEAVDSTLARDSSGNGLHGTVNANPTGSAMTAPRIMLAQSNGRGGRAYRFPSPPVTQDNNQLVLVPGWARDEERLDPRRGDFSVVVRLKTRARHPNVVQKGQGGTAGGHFKLEVSDAPGGRGSRVLCGFEDAAGRLLTVDNDTRLTDISDGGWHVVRCSRVASGNPRLTLQVDATPERVTRGTLGTVDNVKPLSIGGKPECAPTSRPRIDCDYYAGLIDFVRIESSPL